MFVRSPPRSLVEESADSSSALPKEPPGRGLLAYRQPVSYAQALMPLLLYAYFSGEKYGRISGIFFTSHPRLDQGRPGMAPQSRPGREPGGGSILSERAVHSIQYAPSGGWRHALFGHVLFTCWPVRGGAVPQASSGRGPFRSRAGAFFRRVAPSGIALRQPKCPTLGSD